jgi:hypothetical protein
VVKGPNLVTLSLALPIGSLQRIVSYLFPRHLDICPGSQPARAQMQPRGQAVAPTQLAGRRQFSAGAVPRTQVPSQLVGTQDANQNRRLQPATRRLRRIARSKWKLDYLPPRRHVASLEAGSSGPPGLQKLP